MSEKDKEEILNGHEMSEKESEAVGGGVHIDWPADCRATVEDGSGCADVDACYTVFHRYFRDKAKYGCSATVSSRSECWTNDTCTTVQIRYAVCEFDFR